MRVWTVDDVMTKAVVSVDETASYRSVVDELIGHRFSAVPVVDAFGRVSGVVSEADLLRKIEYAGDEAPRLFEGRRRRGERGKALARTAAELASTPAATVLTGTSIAAAARLMDREQVKRLPVVDDLGMLVGIVSRTDLLRVFLRDDDQIAAEVADGLRRVFVLDPQSIGVEVREGVVTLRGELPRAGIIELLVAWVADLDGVVGVHSLLRTPAAAIRGR